MFTWKVLLNSHGHGPRHATSLLFRGTFLPFITPQFWRKKVPTDSLGAPDFDKLAVQRSRIAPGRSCEHYRLGKSLRRKGFDVAGAMVEAPAVLAQAVVTTNTWTARAFPMRVASPNGDNVGDRRSWQCALPEGEVSIPCGGTHVSCTADIGAVAVDQMEPGGSGPSPHLDPVQDEVEPELPSVVRRRAGPGAASTAA